MQKNSWKAWLYLLPAFIFLFVFMIYPLIDVFIYSFEENFSSTKQTYTGVGIENYSYIFSDPEFFKAVKNTFLMVIITVPISTIFALLLALALNSIKPLRKIFETIFFLPYVTNTIAIGIVFMIIFDWSPFSVGMFNNFLSIFNIAPIDWMNGPYAAKMFVLCFYIIWTVLPFKVIVLIGALQTVRQEYYEAAMVDGTSKFRQFIRITLPMISPMISYLIITGFIGAFKEYNNAVALFGEKLMEKDMNTIVGYVYTSLYSENGGFPSYASAAAIILFIIILAITAINLAISKKNVYY